MAMRQKMSECGWFYHAPEKRKTVTEPIEIPITSQIPGLSDLPPEFDDKPREMYFKDTDTKYIRLAKQGGRKDLLVFKDPTPKRREPRGYPRVDWYYLEDNAVQDAAEKKDVDWQFLLPEYMVHEQQQPVGNVDTDSMAYQKQRRAPYAFDTTTAFQREGDLITDKTVKLPELRPPGYGVRINRPLPTKKQGPRDRARRPPNSTQTHADRPSGKKLAPQSHATTDERPEMNKILSYAYDKEWHAKLGKGHVVPSNNYDGTSEYVENYRKLSAASNRSRRDVAEQPTSDKVTEERQQQSVPVSGGRRQQVLEEKEPFKLSKFKNVPARIDSHQKPDTHRSAERKQD